MIFCPQKSNVRLSLWPFMKALWIKVVSEIAEIEGKPPLWQHHSPNQWSSLRKIGKGRNAEDQTGRAQRREIWSSGRGIRYEPLEQLWVIGLKVGERCVISIVDHHVSGITD